ncbi:diguanylate cyclase [Alteromonas sp. ASW11-36]|uniref:diguanylate cyclase n=1 Tax=Alteromonas arenosi TaxID=3055817 RepID=A0ABT7SZF1_9ALTE|nr:diguanylate cyclase [Alteromonas sp. ASW11-36]MDM7861564.1 diguanylate cyclase [Alteromonas sp. ASW11-36]
MTEISASAIAINAPTKRWHLGILSAFVLVCLWGLVFLSLVEKRQQVIGDIYYFSTADTALTVEQAALVDEKTWQSIGSDNSLGMSDDAYWFRFSVPDVIRQDSKEKLLEIDYPMLDHLEIYLVNQSENSFDIIARHQLGDLQVFSQRPIDHAVFLVPLTDVERISHIYARIETAGTVRFPPSIWLANDYIAYTTQHASIMTLFFGFMVAMAICNLFFFITTRSMTFLVYTGYVVTLGLSLAALHGFAFQYLWPNNLYLQGRAIAILASLTLCFAVVFSNQTLDVVRYSKTIEKFLKFLAGMFFVFSLVSWVAPYAIMIKLLMLMLIIAVLSILACGIWLSARGSEVARYYTLAWSFLLLSAFSATLDNLNIVELPVSSHYILIFGASVETLLLGLILAMRYSQQRDSLTAAQAIALEQEQAATKAKDELIKVQQESQDELEYKVQERTLELDLALRELSEANRELEQLSAMDPLTGIPNRRHFDKRLLAESRRSRREQTSLAIAMLDIDHFKQVNDQYGHISGDQCLQQVAKILTDALKRPTDEVCRFGGEEFAFILPNTDVLGATQLLENIRLTVEASEIETDEHTFKVTLSAGVTATTMRREGEELQLLEFADSLLYEAKKNGRNCVINRAFSDKQQDY